LLKRGGTEDLKAPDPAAKGKKKKREKEGQILGKKLRGEAGYGKRMKRKRVGGGYLSPAFGKEVGVRSHVDALQS